MAVVQEMLESILPDSDKLATILDFERVLGLELDRVNDTEELPSDVLEKVDARNQARADRDWALSDQLRDELQDMGYVVQDTKDGTKVFKP